MTPAGEGQLAENPTYVLPLQAPDAARADRSGVKASALSRLLAAGFPVPAGIVVTTEALTAHLREHAAGRMEPGDDVFTRPLPRPVGDALSEALRRFGDQPLAVRSSAVAEDLSGASFAGQYKTVLDVRGPAAVVDAVRACWASALSAHVRAYRAAHRIEADRMAVLIQPLIAADAAGVAFTANPVTGDRAEALVSAVRGLGDRLVSGQATPDEWAVAGNSAVPRRVSEGVLTAQEALAVAELARRVEAHIGVPQDIEWAMSGGKLFLLQARPITTLAPAAEPFPPAPVAASAPPGFWQRADSHYPQPLYPFTRSVLLAAANGGFRRMCAEFGLLWETVEEREIGGWVYLRAVPLGGGKDREPAPDWLARILVRILPALRRRVQSCNEAVRADTAGEWIEKWYAGLRAEMAARLARLHAVALTEISDRDLAAHAGAVRALIADGQRIHMMLNTALNLLLADFVFCCRDLLGWAEERAFEMLAGLSDTSSAPGRALASLAQRVSTSPVLTGLCEDVDGRTAERMAAADPGFAQSLEQYKREFGRRTIRYELADPTLAEMPELLVSLLKAQLRRGYDPASGAGSRAKRRGELAEHARAALATRPAADRERFERTLKRAEQAYPLREEHGFYDTSMPLALQRYAALETGRRLAGRKQIREREDLFLLEFEEAFAALEDGAPRLDLVERRRSERAWALAHPGPQHYGNPPKRQPSFAALPPAARYIHEAVFWFSQRIFAADAANGGAVASVNGIAASAGKYTGVARIVREEAQFTRIQAGDILVCPITSPVWSVLFPSLGALVTDVGGLLSHSAIIAREYGIPAVVATGNATSVLRDGQIVTVDGTAGRVTVVG